MMNEARLPMEPLIGGSGGRYRWVSITSLLLSVGVVVKMITPPIAGLTPNWLISMYCLAILLSRPTLRQSFVIGLVVGCLGLALSKSPFPFANLLSEPAGAVVAWLLVRVPFAIQIGRRKIDLRAGVSTIIATVVSGGVFVITLKLALGLPDVFVKAMLPVVGMVALVNGAFAQAVYFPAKKLFSRLSGEVEKKSPLQQISGELGPQDTTEEERQYEGIILDRCSYSFDGEKRALDEVSIRIPKGTFMVVAGASGAGKTTLAAAFAGLIPHIYGGYGAGKIVVQGKANREETLAERARVVGLVMEDVGSQLVAMTVGEEVAFALENRGESLEEIQRKTVYSLEQVGLKGLEDRPVNQLSGGQRQRLCIARALLKRPKILILDDSTSAVDTATEAKIREAFSTTLKETTKLIIAQRIGSVMEADQIVVMDEGKIVGLGKHEDLLETCKAYQEIYDSQMKKEVIA